MGCLKIEKYYQGIFLKRKEKKNGREYRITLGGHNLALVRLRLCEILTFANAGMLHALLPLSRGKSIKGKLKSLAQASNMVLIIKHIEMLSTIHIRSNSSHPTEKSRKMQRGSRVVFT